MRAAAGDHETRLEADSKRLDRTAVRILKSDKARQGLNRTSKEHTDAQRAPGLFHPRHCLLLCAVPRALLPCSVPFCPVLAQLPYPVPAQRSRETTPTLECDLGSDRAEPYLDLSAGTCPIRSFRSGITSPATVLLAYRTTSSILACTTHAHTYAHTHTNWPTHGGPLFFLSTNPDGADIDLAVWCPLGAKK